MPLSIENFLYLSAVMFIIGTFGLLSNRRSLIFNMLSLELMLIAVNINFIAFSRFMNDVAGEVFVMFILTIAAAESAVGLAILVSYFRNKGSIRADTEVEMHG